MACTGVLRVGDDYTKLEFLIEDCKSDGTTEPLDITLATDITIRFKRTDGSEQDEIGLESSEGINGNGSDGLVFFITPAGFITDADIGTLQAIVIVTFPGNSKYHSSPAKFKVKDNF